ncbi:hypothetical protein AcW1_007468 [Taiwanofungus camphoratus]|nr:hypothetical protein AcW2_007476 [Antrodia cinnamomea]KAI0927224.1 hypothetical protein AcV5_007813 [Antrodia cinnamomea]KAI0953174.1 hypothetical protein AcW1_007468 [Antrodia cinnamomea]
MEWLNEYAFKAEENLDVDPSLARRVYRRLAARLVEHGTGAVLLFGTIKTETNLILAEVMQAAGIRAFVGKLSMDISSRQTYIEDSAAMAISSARTFVDQCIHLVTHLPHHNRFVEPVITPRFIPTCSDALLKGLGELARERNLRLQSHMAEAHDQVEWVKRERGSADIEVFASNDLLTPRTIQAHCTFLDPPSLAQMVNYDTAIAHCPLSNAYFSAEPFRLREALDLGVKVGLGTDIAGGYSIDIMNCMRQAVVVSRMREGARVIGPADGMLGQDEKNGSLAIGWKEALYLATRGGAIALGLAKGSGTFTVGAAFDAQCIRVYDAVSGTGIGPLDFFDDTAEGGMTKELTNDMIEKWWCLGDAQNREGMWIQGKKMVV